MTDSPPEMGSVHHAQVQRIAPFGIFVEMAGYRKWGLVPVFQISDYLDVPRETPDDEKVRTISGVVTAGDSAWVKVVDVYEDEQGRPMKLLTRKQAKEEKARLKEEEYQEEMTDMSSRKRTGLPSRVDALSKPRTPPVSPARR